MRPIRFGTGAGRPDDAPKLLAAARTVEELGYSTFGVADHFAMAFAPLVTLQAVASVTTTLRLTQMVLVQDFRHPAVLAKELATLDVFSGGRLEVGIGAGWMREEFAQAGIRFDPPSVRIERMEEAALVLTGLFGDEPFSFAGEHFTITGLDGTPKPVQRPRPPLMVGGGGPRLLAAAARQADIIQVLPSSPGKGRSPQWSSFTPQSYREKVDVVREAAGDRLGDIELSTLLLKVAITDDPRGAIDDLVARFGADPDEILASPVVAVGSVAQVCDKLLATRDAFGFSYFVNAVGTPPQVLAPVIERIAGR